MGLFSKKQPIPEWANFFSARQYKKFIQCVKEYFNHGLTINEEEGYLEVDGTSSVYGLFNLAHICHLNKDIDYKEIIREHFDTLILTEKFSKEFDKNSDNFDYVKDYLATRIYDLDYIDSAVSKDIICKQISDNLYQVLVYDFPHSISTIKKEKLLSWNKNIDELFAIGLANLKEKYQQEISLSDMGEFKLWLILDEQGFATRIILDREELSKYLGREGALIGMPNANLVMIYPIESLEVIKVVHVMARIINNQFNSAKSVSDKLYWLNQGRFSEIRYEIAEDKINIGPPQEFLEMLNGLSE